MRVDFGPLSFGRGSGPVLECAELERLSIERIELVAVSMALDMPAAGHRTGWGRYCEMPAKWAWRRYPPAMLPII